MDRLRNERERLEREAGLPPAKPAQFKRPEERKFTADQRPHTTLLIGGLTIRHDRLVKAGLEGLGYKIANVPVPVKLDFQTGKEFGNNGQCNPTYFTVGSLVNYLRDLRDKQGIQTQEILDKYVFVTAGACGPCRFGMYEAEYRLALRNSGFDGFRVILIDQGVKADAAAVEAGLNMNVDFTLSVLNAILIGDLLNEVSYHIRPYEVVPGKTNEVLEECMQLVVAAFHERGYDRIEPDKWASLLTRVTPLSKPKDAAKFLDQLQGEYFPQVLRRCAQLLDEKVEVDYTRSKPVVKVTGEFWAQTTEGDGNFNMFPFLEREGAEVLVEPVVTWLGYLMHQAKTYAKDKRGLDENQAPISKFDLWGRLKREGTYQKKKVVLALADTILRREYERLRAALGGTAHKPVDQLEMQRLGHPFYNSRSGGGEGHLEVAKNIYYSTKGMCHMVLSLKPFGCMPSTQSDGAQAAVTSQYPDMIYLPVETSGEGDINAHSRVQMALGSAKVKSKNEFKAALAKVGYSLPDIQAYVAEHRDLRRPLVHFEHIEGVAGRAASFVQHVAGRMDADAAWRSKKGASERVLAGTAA